MVVLGGLLGIFATLAAAPLTMAAALFMGICGTTFAVLSLRE